MHYERYRDRQGEWRWRLRADNGRIIATSSEGYVAKRDCTRGIDLVKGSAPAPVEDKD